MRYTNDQILEEALADAEKDKELIASLEETVATLLIEITSLRGQVAALEKMLAAQKKQVQ